MFPNEKARLMRMMDSHGVPAVNEAGVKMDFTQRVTWLIEHANQQSVQADGRVLCACIPPLADTNSMGKCEACGCARR